MLEQILNHLHNYFIVKDGVHTGEFEIVNGSINLDFLQTGQYFRISGSVFNDGVYQYPVSGLQDESFSGSVWAMAVPPAVISLSTEIGEWVGKYGDSADSPYTSESFGGYSYSKGAGGADGSGHTTWQSVFATRLNHWRKV